MISNKAYFMFTLATFNYVLSKEEPSQGIISGLANDGSIEFPNVGRPPRSSLGSSGLPFSLPDLGNPPTLSPETSSVETGRKRRETDDDDENVIPELQSRLIFSRLPVLISCNYTAQPGFSCLSCRQSLRCFHNNIGLLKNCAGLFRHCNNGRCSLIQSSECSATSTPSSSTTSSSTTSSSTSSSTTSATSLAATTTTPSGLN